MARQLTKKQRGFVKDYIETGIGSLAVKRNYDVIDDVTARSIATENLTKPLIVKAIAERIPDDLLEQRHLELLNKRELQYSPDGDLLSDQPDTQAVTKALDMAYKLKGAYAPEKSQSMNVNLDVKAEDKDGLEAIREEFLQKIKASLSKDANS